MTAGCSLLQRTAEFTPAFTWQAMLALTVHFCNFKKLFLSLLWSLSQHTALVVGIAAFSAGCAVLTIPLILPLAYMFAITISDGWLLYGFQIHHDCISMAFSNSSNATAAGNGLVRIMHLVVLVTPMVVVVRHAWLLITVLVNAAAAAMMPADCCTSCTFVVLERLHRQLHFCCSW